MKAWDFFCGAGGATRGFLDAGIDVLGGIDLDSRCRDTYTYNNPGVEFHNADIRHFSAEIVNSEFASNCSDDVILIGCAPCQPFSIQNKGLVGKHDDTLLCHFGSIVESILPGYVVIENVPGITLYRSYVFEKFLNMLEMIGYKYCYGVLNAKHFGVPQNRRRLILIASRITQPSLPTGIVDDIVTVRDAIYNFPPLTAGESHSDVPNHVSPSLSDLNLLRLQATPHDGGDRKSWPDQLWLKCHKTEYTGHSDVYGRMFWDRPSPTLTRRCTSISNGRYGHPDQDRAISLREAASLQSFDSDYVFFGSNTHIALQIGNAVPVKLAEEIGRHILKLCNSSKL